MQGKEKDAADASKQGEAGMKQGEAGMADNAAGGLHDATVALTARHKDDETAAPMAPTSEIASDNQDLDEGGAARLDDAAQALIGQHLKAVYSEIVQQPVPEEFLKLLEELERKERS